MAKINSQRIERIEQAVRAKQGGGTCVIVTNSAGEITANGKVFADEAEVQAFVAARRFACVVKIQSDWTPGGEA